MIQFDFKSKKRLNSKTMAAKKLAKKGKKGHINRQIDDQTDHTVYPAGRQADRKIFKKKCNITHIY